MESAGGRWDTTCFTRPGHRSTRTSWRQSHTMHGIGTPRHRHGAIGTDSGRDVSSARLARTALRQAAVRISTDQKRSRCDGTDSRPAYSSLRPAASLSAFNAGPPMCARSGSGRARAPSRANDSPARAHRPHRCGNHLRAAPSLRPSGHASEGSPSDWSSPRRRERSAHAHRA